MWTLTDLLTRIIDAVQPVLQVAQYLSSVAGLSFAVAHSQWSEHSFSAQRLLSLF